MRTHTRNGLLFVAGCIGVAVLLWSLPRAAEWARAEPPEAISSDSAPVLANDTVADSARSKEDEPAAAAGEAVADNGLAQEGTPLQLMITVMEQQSLENGLTLVTVEGRVINPTASALRVPAIHAEVRDASGNVMHRWTIAPPAKELQAGTSASFEAVEVDVPAGGTNVTVTLG